MIDCPCGYGKNIKDDQQKCPVCGMDLTPIHRLKKAGEAVRSIRDAGAENEKTIREQQKLLSDQKNRLKALRRFLAGAAVFALAAALVSILLLLKPDQIQEAAAPSPVPTPALTEDMEARLQGYATLNELGVKVSETADSVLVSGEVSSAEQRAFIMDIVTNEAGDKHVDADDLIVKETAIPFSELAENLKTAYAGYADLKNAGLEVSATAGEISVSGTVAADVYKNLAIEVAKNHIDESLLNFTSLGVEPPPSALPEPPTCFVYTVRPGDSLAGIAYTFYGDHGMWTRIYDANAEDILDANSIRIGQVIKIPLD